MTDTRRRRLARHVATLAMVSDTPEGRTAADLAGRQRRKHGFTDAEIEDARADVDADRCVAVSMEGWSDVWLFAMCDLAAQAEGCVCGIEPAGGRLFVPRFVGPGAGRAARLARATRARIAAAVGRLGGEDGVRALPAGKVMVPAKAAMASTFAEFSYAYFTPSVRVVTLGERCGSLAVHVFRVVLAYKMLSPAAERRAHDPMGSKPAGVVPPGANTGPPSPPPETSPADVQAANDLHRSLLALVQAAGAVAGTQPVWADLHPEPVAVAGYLPAP